MASFLEEMRNVLSRLVDAVGAVVAIILLLVFVVALALIFVNSCIDTPDAGDDFGLSIHGTLTAVH